MKYCTECGKPLEPQLQFCTECGTKQETPSEKLGHDENPANQQSIEDSSANVSKPASAPPPTQPAKKPMKKSTKIILAATILFVGILFGVHQFLSSHFDPMNDLQAMDKAVASGNSEEFISYIEFNNEALLDEEAYMQYIKDYEWDSAKSQLRTIIDSEDPLTSKVTNMDGVPLFTVQPEEHVFGLYSTFSLKAEPAMLTVHTTMDETKVEVEDITETINTDEPAEFSVYPGTYKLAGNAANMFGKFTYENTIEMNGQQTIEATVEFPDNTHSFSTNQKNAKLFVNGEDTGVKLSEIDTLGPFPEDKDVTMHAEWTNSDGDVIKTESVTQHDSSLFGGIPFSFEETVQNETDESQVASTETPGSAGDTVIDFRNAYEKALNSKDYSLIAPYMLEGSEAEDGLLEYINDLEDKGYHYNFETNDVLDVEEVDDETVIVTTNELFTFTNHRDEQTDYDRTKTYTMKLDDDSYKISLIEYQETNRD